MSWVAVAIAGGAVIGGVASSISADKTSGAMTDAANTQAAAANNAAALQNQQYLQARADLAPWRTAGATALNQLSAGTQPGGQFDKFGGVDMTQDPGYKFRMEQGVNALAASGAAAGNYGSGNMGVALQKFGQDYGSREYGNAYARQYGAWQDEYNRLAGIAGTGQTAATNIGQMGMTSAANQGNLMVGGANALAAGQVGAAQAQAGGMTGVANQFQSGVGTYLNYQNTQAMLKAFQDGGYGGYGTPNYGAETPYGYQTGGYYGNLPK